MKTETNAANAAVLVTGIGGFLAGHVAFQLLKQGYRVRGSLRHIEKSDACDVCLALILARMLWSGSASCRQILIATMAGLQLSKAVVMSFIPRLPFLLGFRKIRTL